MLIPAPLRALMLLSLAVVALAACADDAAEAPDDGDDVAEEAETAIPDDADETSEEPRDEALAENLDGCVEDPDRYDDHFPEQVTFEHAERVEVDYAEDHKLLEIDVAFQDEPVRYALVQCGLDHPDVEDAAVVEIPVDTAVTLTTANLAHVAGLDAVDRLVGVGTPDFVASEPVVDAIEAGAIEGFADAEGVPDLERLIAAAPDAAVLDAFGDDVLSQVDRLAEAGVPAVLNADFDEPDPLGRAEWVKVTALLLNAEAAASDLFDEIAEGYEELAERVEAADDRPRVLLDEPFEGTWYAAGGQSLTATLIEDAGGEYVFADDEATGSLAYDIEAVLDRGADADVWIGAGSVHGSLDDLAAADDRFGSIRAFEEGEVWAGDADLSPGGGNNRFERGALRADELLADYAAILHPDLVDHEPRYYGRVGDEG